MSLIENNGALNLPLCDDQTADISLFLMLCLWHAEAPNRIAPWLESMVSLQDITVRANGRYPTSLHEYTDLVEHPRERSKEYFEEATAGSTLIPVLAMWTKALGRPDLSTQLARLTSEKLAHCTMQAWTPGKDSEEHLYVNSKSHGLAIADLPIKEGAADLVETVIDGCKEGAFQSLSAIKTGVWPIVLTACRHWRLPVPPEFFVHALTSDTAAVPEKPEDGEPNMADT